MIGRRFDFTVASGIFTSLGTVTLAIVGLYSAFNPESQINMIQKDVGEVKKDLGEMKEMLRNVKKAVVDLKNDMEDLHKDVDTDFRIMMQALLEATFGDKKGVAYKQLKELYEKLRATGQVSFCMHVEEN